MALIPYEPFRDIDSFFEGDDDWFFPVTKRETSPQMDVYETEDNIVAEVSVPGMNSEDLNVTVSEGALRIRGERSEEIKDEEKGYFRREIRRGSFERVVRLPSNIDEDKVKASYEDGILKVEVPKVDEAEDEKTIKIESK